MNTLSLPPKYILPVLSVSYGCSADGSKPDFKNLTVSWGRKNTASLYYNGVFYFRFMLPFYVGLMIRWSGSTTKKAFIQTHLGWKLNGDAAATFRIQSDESGRISNKGPEFDNRGQATGWNCGAK